MVVATLSMLVFATELELKSHGALAFSAPANLARANAQHSAPSRNAGVFRQRVLQWRRAVIPRVEGLDCDWRIVARTGGEPT